MRFPDYESSHDPIELPYAGKTYALRQVPSKFGLSVREAEARGVTPLADMEPREQLRQLIGPDTYDRMIDDDVPDNLITVASLVSMLDWKINREEAEKAWTDGVNPELLAALTAAAESKLPDETDSTGTASGEKTQTPASTSDTTSRKKPQDRKAKASHGGGSSNTGG